MEITHKEICDYMRDEMGCYRCGSKWDKPCVNCQFSFNHWSKCYEEAKQALIRRKTPKMSKASSGSAAKAFDELLDYLEEKQ